MKIRIKYLVSLLVFLQIQGCAYSKISQSSSINDVFCKWENATFSSLYNNLNNIIQAGADSASVTKNTLPIFQNYITSSRYECFNAFNDAGYSPFKNLYYADILVLEIFRSDNCETKVMHIVDNSIEIEYSFIRSCRTNSQTRICKKVTQDAIYKFVEDFRIDFQYKESCFSYTGIITYIENGNFTCFPLLYLSNSDIEKLTSCDLGLE